MSSRYVHELREFADRICKDGYPTALLERCADRMEAMEHVIVDLSGEETKYEGDVEGPTWKKISLRRIREVLG